MKETKKPIPLDCSSEHCDWVFNRHIQCVDGNGFCAPSRLLEGELSGFHDQALIDATKKINRILAKIPADAEGRKLSLLFTKMGAFLAWAKHGGKPRKGVTAEDSDAKVIKALKLKV